jgi:hypothetical protein
MLKAKRLLLTGQKGYPPQACNPPQRSYTLALIRVADKHGNFKTVA